MINIPDAERGAFRLVVVGTFFVDVDAVSAEAKISKSLSQ